MAVNIPSSHLRYLRLTFLVTALAMTRASAFATNKRGLAEELIEGARSSPEVRNVALAELQKEELNSEPEAGNTKQDEASTPTPFDLILLAGRELEAGRPDNAIERYDAVMIMDVPAKTAAEACLGRGNAYRMKGDSERAMRDYEEAVKLDPRNPSGYVYRGLMLSASGDHAGAIRDLSEAVRFDPKMYRAFYNRAGDYMAMENLPLARRDLDEAIRLYPKYARAFVRRGAVHAYQGQMEEAERDYKKATVLQPTDAAGWAGLAQVDLVRRRYAAALRNLEKGLEINPPQPEAWLDKLARIRSTSPVKSVRNGAKAIQEALQACQLSHWAVGGYVETLAAAYAEAGKFEKASDFQWFAISLANDQAVRAEAERRLRLYDRHQPFREGQSDGGSHS